MAYVRTKKTKGREYYQLVEGRRENGKVRQKVLLHLGDCPSEEKALWWWPGRILRMWHVARDARLSTEFTLESMREAVRGEAIGGWNEQVAPKRAREEAMYRQKAVARYMDEDGNMRRLKHGPHDVKEMRFREALHQERSIHDMYLSWNIEYWSNIDYAEQLERRASELEERYVKLYAINGGDPDEARRLLRERFQRLLEGYERRSQRLEAKRQEERRALGTSILGEVAKSNPSLALQAIMHGYEVPDE